MFDKFKVKRAGRKIKRTAISLAEFNASAIKAKMDFLARKTDKKISDEFILRIVEHQLEDFNKLAQGGRTIRRKIQELKNIPTNKFLREIKNLRDGLRVLMKKYLQVLEKEHHNLVHNDYAQFSANFKKEKKISVKAESTLGLLKIKVAELEALKKNNKLTISHGKGAIYGAESLVLAASMSGQAGYIEEDALKSIVQIGVGLVVIILLWKLLWGLFIFVAVVAAIGAGIGFMNKK